MCIRCLLVVLGLWSGVAAQASAAEDTYFVVLFGQQQQGCNKPSLAHSYATFIHLTADGQMDSFTISWLPVTGKVRTLSPMPEEGRNFTLEETLKIARDNHLEISLWGPYQIQPELWCRAMRSKAWLDSGKVLYQAFDYGAIDGRVCNCVHAVAHITGTQRSLLPSVFVAPSNWGKTGSYWAALAMTPWFLEPCRTHDSLLPRLGLNAEDYVRHGLDHNPSTNPIKCALQAALHHRLMQNRVNCEP